MRPVEIELMASVAGAHWWYQGLRDMIGRSLLRPGARFPTGARILDAGCGTGENLLFLEGLLRPAYAGGFDLSPLAVRHCRAKVPAADVYVSDIRDPDVHVADLDLVLSCDVLSIAGIRESLAGMTRLVGRLRRGGLLILNLPAFAWLRSRHDVATDTRDRITARQMRQLLTELGLSIEVISYRLCFLFPAILLARLPSMLRQTWAHGAGAQSAASSDLRLAPKWVNPLLSPLLHAENAAIVHGMRFPWGSSVYAVARKP
jgi:SAM-dependent methyltransferase